MDLKKPCCPVVEVDGVIAGGKQFDLDITLPCDNRNVIYGVIRDCYREPVKDAVVKLIEVVYDCGKEERRPVSHTFTDEDGEFVFGPLCPDKKYEINFWVNQVKHVKLCAKCSHEGECLKSVKMEKCDCYIEDKKEHCKEKDYNKDNSDKEDYKDKDHYNKDYSDKDDYKNKDHYNKDYSDKDDYKNKDHYDDKDHKDKDNCNNTDEENGKDKYRLDCKDNNNVKFNVNCNI